MRLIVEIVLVLALFVLGSSQIAQRPAQDSKEAQELRRLEDEWLSSYLRADKTIFDRIVADDFTGTDESAKLRNKTQERELIQAPPTSIKASLTNEEVQVRMYEGTAVVTGRIVSRALLGGQGEISFQSRFTDTLLKRQGRWQVVARHYSRIPPEHTAVNLDPKVYRAYIGQYEIAPNFVLTGFFVCRLDDGSIVGSINLSQIFRGGFQNAYLGYHVGEGHSGQGYMTEALQLMLRYAFEDLKLHRLEANIQPGNIASIAMVKRAGFVQEGYSRRYLKICGRWRDQERWAIIADDWRATRTRLSRRAT